MNTVPVKGKRRGFLPFDTNPFDRVFVSVILTIAVHLLWVRFLEEHVSLTVATILMLLVSAIIIARG
jgi:predicted small integral membrane protein